jgi:hypothetical protein
MPLYPMGRQTGPLVIRKPGTPGTELSLRNPVLFAQVRDCVSHRGGFGFTYSFGIYFGVPPRL